MAFGGAWSKRRFSVDPDELLHTADPAHNRPGHGEDPNPVWQDSTPAEERTPEYIADYGDMDWLVADTPGIVLDSTPVDHSQGGGTKSYPNEVSAQSGAYAASSADFGADRKHVFEVPPMQDSTTRYMSARFEGVDTYAPPIEALQRGLNGLPQNNPDGFRKGWVEQAWVDRKMYDPVRVHDRRLNTLNVATVATDQPVPENANAYTSPFTSLARIIRSVNQKPMIRREPPPISESLVTDGEENMYDATSGDWVVG